MAHRQRPGSGPGVDARLALAELRRERWAELADAYLRAQDAYLTAREAFQRMLVAYGERRYAGAEAVEFQARTGDFRALSRVVHELARSHWEPGPGVRTRP